MEISLTKKPHGRTLATRAQRSLRGPAATGYVLLLPALILLVITGIYPLIRTITLSFTNTTLIEPFSSNVGFSNYTSLLQDIWFKTAYTNTWMFTAVSVAGELVLGLIAALAIDQRFHGRRFVRVSLLIPWAIPTVVSARMWAWLFNTQYGIINYLLHNAGILASNENWLGDPNVAMWTAIVADVWKTTSFMTLILYAGLQLVPDEIKEAAAADGAGALRSFFSITLPILIPTMLTAVLLRALDAYRVFDLIFVLTGGGPANSTQVLSTYTYSTMFSATQLGYGSAMAVAMAISMLLFAVIIQLILRLTEWKFG